MSSRRISANRRAWLDARLSVRDRLVLDWLSRLRLATGQQLEALCFDGLASSSRPVVRGRVLGRLVTWGLLELVDRRVGGSVSGSTSGVYRLSAAGHLIAEPAHTRPTRPYTDRFTAHTLTTSQLAADLVEALQDCDDVTLHSFLTEPASWMPDDLGSFLKPDAYIQLQTEKLTMHWWIEVDLGTESLPALERKLRSYLDFVNRGQLGPAGVVPQVLLTLTGEERVRAVATLLDRLPPPALELFVACSSGRAVVTLLAALDE